MELIDFSKNKELNDLRAKMGAEYQDYETNIEWSPIDLKRLQNEGIDVPISELTIDQDGIFLYKGKRVLVYIRDQHKKYDGKYKYHIAECKTIQDQKKYNRYGRYVVSTRTDGQFIVNITQKKLMVEKNALKKMNICKNCLEKINHKEYNYVSKTKQKEIYQHFNLSEVIDNTSVQITKPKHTDKSAPINQYSENFDLISRKLREKNNWICEKCGRSFKENKNLLHVHHINSMKSDNNIENLKCLCHECHANEPGHEHMNNGIAF